MTDTQLSLADRAVYSSRVRGCLIGGAVGDALGNPVEFIRTASELEARYPHGVGDFADAVGHITDDTQMTMFTMEGLIRANVRSDRGTGFTIGVVHHAYYRWHDTQVLRAPSGKRDGWLQAEKWLYARRAPGNTCLTALSDDIGTYGCHTADNNSKGCGTVMRVAPVGLLPSRWTQEYTFDWGIECAGYTHGHRTGQLAAGTLALLISRIVDGASLDDALDHALRVLRLKPGHQETLAAVERARKLAREHQPSMAVLAQLGQGWIAEEALAIAVYAALCYARPEQFLDALSLAVCHPGDSDSTGAICGNILGALHGIECVPPELAFRVEGRAALLQLADDFVAEFTQADRLHDDDEGPDHWSHRYPGW